ncbi:hypothetical protein ABZS66_38190 [Dactylosporangium sp. NPDC005572]|uniref:hypothetical protein n=1 Tax=Dactylosporangium sp. NPDC005572 TaxID=3156889 RepID=UPI0033BA286F
MRTIATWLATTAVGVTALIFFQLSRPAGEEDKGGPRPEDCRPATAAAAAAASPAPTAPGCEGGENDHQGGKPGERK